MSNAEERYASAVIAACATSSSRMRGGLTLEYWQLYDDGVLFGEPVLTTKEAVARRLRVPVSELQKVIDDTRMWVYPQLAGDPEFHASLTLTR